MATEPGALPAPLGVWDANEQPYDELMEKRVAWAVEHIRDAASTYRAEFHLADCPFAVLYRYAADDDGCPFLDPATGRPAVAEPVMQVLDELPPGELLRQGGPDGG